MWQGTLFLTYLYGRERNLANAVAVGEAEDAPRLAEGDVLLNAADRPVEGRRGADVVRVGKDERFRRVEPHGDDVLGVLERQSVRLFDVEVLRGAMARECAH